METLKFLRRAHDQAVALAKPLKLDGLNAQHRAALLLYGTIIELAGAFTALCEQRLWVGAPSTARCALEAYIDFRNVCEDAKYVRNLEAHVEIEHLTKLKAARDEENAYFEGVRGMGNLEELIKSAQQRVEELRKEGFTKLNIRTRFEKRKAEHVYLSIYNSLSDEAHNSLVTLYRRQLEGQNGIRFALYREEPRNDFLPLVDLVASVVTDVTIQIHKFLDTKNSEVAKELQTELAEIRKGYKVAA
jgi:uncharacterized protein DUF5677